MSLSVIFVISLIITTIVNFAVGWYMLGGNPLNIAPEVFASNQIMCVLFSVITTLIVTLIFMI